MNPLLATPFEQTAATAENQYVQVNSNTIAYPELSAEYIADFITRTSK